MGYCSWYLYAVQPLLYVMIEWTLHLLPIKRADNPKQGLNITPEMGDKLLDLIKKYFNVPFSQDLHMENVMEGNLG